jgi:putative heme degradation protein
VLNDVLSARLNYFSNRRVSSFNDLSAVYNAGMIINEKIDLEIARQNFNAELGNTAENLQDFKQLIQVLSEYYRNFLREHKKKGR